MIVVKDLVKMYKNQHVLRGLNLTIEEGETLVVVGRSGMGKSVLLRQILGIEKPDSGTVEVGGKMVSKLKGNALYRAIQEMGMLFQAAALFDSMTVFENTAFYLSQHGKENKGGPYTTKELKDKVAEALHMVGLDGTEELLPSSLSGGMRKRAALARLIVYRPKVLLYDEPTTGLDPITAMQISDLILKIQQELRATSVVVTHDLCSAFRVGNRIALIDGGKIAYIGTKQEFLQSDNPTIVAFLKNAIPDGDLKR